MALRMVRVDRQELGHGVHFQWSSIFAGAFITVGLGLFFLVLGDSVGLNVYNVVNPSVQGSLKFWSWIYNAVCLVLSYGLGSSLATRTNQIESTAAGGLHGIASWGLTSAIAAVIMMVGGATARSILQGTGPNAANWFVLSVIGVGFVASVIGGMGGKQSVRYVREQAPTSGQPIKPGETRIA